MFKATIGRRATASLRMRGRQGDGRQHVGGVRWCDDVAVVDGDFAVTEDELGRAQGAPGGGINIVAIHHHMTGESPRILFLYWGKGRRPTLLPRFGRRSTSAVEKAVPALEPYPLGRTRDRYLIWMRLRSSRNDRIRRRDPRRVPRSDWLRASTVGIVIGLGLGGAAAFAALATVFGDRIGRRRMLSR